LKRRYLRKHQKDVNRYYRILSNTDLHSETALQYKDRLVRWSAELFTFLDADRVPWNDNNAEHGVKTFAARRKSGSGFFYRGRDEAVFDPSEHLRDVQVPGDRFS
jgi:hypothetical protein